MTDVQGACCPSCKGVRWSYTFKRTHAIKQCLTCRWRVSCDTAYDVAFKIKTVEQARTFWASVYG